MSFLDLMIAVKNVRIIKFWDICDLENLLARLEIDRPIICRPIVELLLPSFFPKAEGLGELIQRCIKISDDNRGAARKFYDLAAQNETKDRLIELMSGILDSLRNFLKNKKETAAAGKENAAPKRKLYNSNASTLDESVETADTSTLSSISSSTISSNTTTGSREAEVENPQDLHPFNRLETVGGLLDVVCVLWYKLNPYLTEDANIEHRAVLERKATKSILLLFKFYRDTSISDTVVYLASFLSHSAASVVASYCFSQLKKSSRFEIHVEALCNWRRGDEVVELMKEWLEVGLGKASSSSVESTGVRFREPDADKPYLNKAIKVMNHLIDGETTRLILLAKNCDQLEDLLETTTKILDTIQGNNTLANFILSEG